jgi:sugar phosphate isomerase/epimerase
MNKMNRRRFLQHTTVATGALAIANIPKQLFAAANALDISLGFQTWTLRESLGKDFPGTLNMMSAQGYKITELCSPKGYENAGFGPLLSMKTSEMRKIINDSGLSCPSCHFGLSEFTDHLEDRTAFAKELGLSEMICSSFGLPKTASLNDYLMAADKLNEAGKKIKDAGMQAGFHNHSTEFAQLDGQLIYDALMQRLDPDLVKMQFQTEVINLGYKASDYFKKYAGRFVSSHLSDWTTDKKEVPIGQGVIDWKEFFTAAKTGGVKHFFVEMSPGTFKESAEYVQKLRV